MSDDAVFKMNEIRAELEKTKEEEIQKQSHELKNEMTFKSSIETVNEDQSEADVLSTNVKEIQQTVTALSNRDEICFCCIETISRKLDKDDKILRDHNEVSTKQNETTQVLNTSENNHEKQTILLLGGDNKLNKGSLLMLENNGQNWKQLDIRLPYGVTTHGAQFLNNNLYIFGGVNAKYEPLSCTYKLSKNLQWKKMADMNEERRWISNSSVILNNQIWVCGGHNVKGELKSVEMYDPETNKWKYMKEMNECRSHAAAAVVNGKIFCSGGEVDSVECYDPSSNVWTFICNMSEEIGGHGAIELNGHLIVMGGDSFGSRTLKNVWALNTTDENAEWIEKPSMSTPRYGVSIAKIDDKIFVCGGYGDDVGLDSVEIFDGEVWKSGPKMPTSRKHAPVVVIPIEFARELEKSAAVLTIDE